MRSGPTRVRAGEGFGRRGTIPVSAQAGEDPHTGTDVEGARVETSYLKEYIAFSRSLSYAKAADELFISQPTLRSHVRALEDELGIQLTQKRSNRLELSAAGKVFLSRAREIVDLGEQAVEEARAARAEYATVTVGTLGCWWFEEMLLTARKRFEERNPCRHIEVLFASGMYANVESLIEGDADVCLYPHTRSQSLPESEAAVPLPADLACKHLRSEPQTFWLTDENPLFALEVITPRDLTGQAVLVSNTSNMGRVGRIVQRVLREAGAEVEVRNWPFQNYSEYFFSGAADTFGIYMRGIAPDLEQRSNFRVFTIEGVDLINDACMVYSRSRLDQCAAAYIDELVALAD